MICSRCWPIRWAFSGWLNQLPINSAGSWRRISATSDWVSRNFSCTNCPRFSPIRSLLRGIIAVCCEINGIGTRRKSATTANQSASAPTIAASAIALIPSTQKLGGRNSVMTKVAAAISSNESASRLARLSSAILFIGLRIEPDGGIAKNVERLPFSGGLGLLRDPVVPGGQGAEFRHQKIDK